VDWALHLIPDFCFYGWTERNRALPRRRPFRQAQLRRRGHQQLCPDRGSGVVSQVLNLVTQGHVLVRQDHPLQTRFIHAFNCDPPGEHSFVKSAMQIILHDP
jgi:hypothetical protein